MKRQLLILTIIFFLVATIASAAEFYVSTTAVKKDIFVSEVAEFNFTIQNLRGTSDVYTLSTQDTNWIILDQQVQVAADSSETFTIGIVPAADVPLGVHAVKLKVKSQRTGEFIEEVVVVNIRPYDPVFGQYRPSVQFGASIDKEVDPTQKVPVEVYMRNRNALDIGEVSLLIDGDIFARNVKTTIGPLEEKRVEYLFEIDDLQEPGLYSLDVQLQVKNVTIGRSTQSYEVIGYSKITIDREEKSFLFKTTDVITLQNLGNMEKTKQVNLEMAWLKRIFTSSDLDYEVVKSTGTTSLQWDVDLEPQEMQKIRVYTNYRIPIVIIFLIILGVVLYYVFRSPIVLEKEAFVSESTKEGIEKLKIRLFVKNRSAKNIEHIGVHERVPGIAEVEKKKSLGTLEPDKITKREKKGTLMKWSLENLEPYEERIITYEIKSKLKIIGNISLPSTRATFMQRNKERTIYSNKVIVSG